MLISLSRASRFFPKKHFLVPPPVGLKVSTQGHDSVGARSTTGSVVLLGKAREACLLYLPGFGGVRRERGSIASSVSSAPTKNKSCTERRNLPKGELDVRGQNAGIMICFYHYTYHPRSRRSFLRLFQYDRTMPLPPEEHYSEYDKVCVKIHYESPSMTMPHRFRPIDEGAVTPKRHQIGPASNRKKRSREVEKEREKLQSIREEEKKKREGPRLWPLSFRAKKQCALMPRGTELQNFPTPEGKGPD
jgi:hypothetical protein